MAFLDNFPGWSTNFELLWRQEQSRHASGRTRVKDFGTPLWTASFQSKNLSPNNMDMWRAKLNALQNGLVIFKAGPTSRCWPILYPNGDIPETNWVLDSGFWDDDGVWLDGYSWDSGPVVGGEIATIGLDNKSISVAWTSTEIQLSIGDYIEVNSARLYQITDVLEDDMYQVIPFLSLSTLVGQTVNIHKPSVDMTINPGSISTQTGLNGRGSISFSATEARG